MIADHIGISTREVRFWLTPWARTDDHLPLSHIAEVLHTRGIFWDSISVESSGGSNPLITPSTFKNDAGAVDQLFGQAGTDWFITSPGDVVNDLDTTSGELAIDTTLL